MPDFPMDEKINEATASAETAEQLRETEDPIAAAAEQTAFAEVAGSAEAAEGFEAAAAAEASEPAACAEPAGTFETAETAEASWSSDADLAAAPVSAPVSAARPRKAARSARSDNPGRVWGICIGLALGFLCCGCIVLLTFFAVNAGRGVRLPAGPAPSQSQTQTQQPEEPDRADISIEIHEVPRDEDGYTTQYVYEQVRDSVVGILVYDGSSIEAVGGGTGIIMSEDGYIITNAHVVVDSPRLTVIMHDETRHFARVIGYDEKTDLAVIKIDATGLQPAEFGDSDNVVVGERVIAIGNPGGLAGSVSQGIVSGLDREVGIRLSDNTRTTITAIQTDAAINPGNSGGPLLNAWGQVIGINSAKIVASGYEGIGFSIPVNEAKPVLDNLIQYGYVRDRAVVGIQVIELNASNGPANGLPSQGLYITSIEPNSDMNRLGIKPGDVILKADGVEVVTTEELTEMLKNFRPGDTITLEILQMSSNRTVTVDVLLQDSRTVVG